MATPIKEVPILSGDLADEFVRLAEENQSKPRKSANPNSRVIVREMERQLRECVPSWKV